MCIQQNNHDIFKNNFKIFYKYFTPLKFKVCQHDKRVAVSSVTCTPDGGSQLGSNSVIIRRDECFQSVDFNTSMKLHRNGEKCEC
jgi:hypothetical protein